MAAAAAVTTAGRAVLLSGTALIVALILATAIAPTPILTSIGIGVLLCSALATGAAVVVMPAVLTLLGTRIDAFSFPAPRFLARGWDWLVGRGRWVTRWAVPAGAIATAALVALALPVGDLKTGPPDVTMLPASTQARQDFERVAAVMGPGWPTPFKIVVVSTKQPITAPAMLKQVQAYQATPGAGHARRLGRRPGRLRGAEQRPQGAAQGPETPPKLLKGGKKDLGKLESGLGQAGDGRGSAPLRSRRAPPPAPASCKSGSGAARARARASSTPDSARRAPAPLKISGGLAGRAGRRDRAEERLGCRARGLGEARRRARPGREARPGRAAGVPAARRGRQQRLDDGDRRERRRSGHDRPDRRGARAAALDDRRQERSRATPETLSALTAARTSAGGVQSALAGVQPKLAGRRRRLDGGRQAGRRPVGRPEPALRRLDRSCRAASPSCARATPTSRAASASSTRAVASSPPGWAR